MKKPLNMEVELVYSLYGKIDSPGLKGTLNNCTACKSAK